MSELALDYAQLAFPAGGDMEGRMQFMVGASCRTISETIGSYDCAVWTPLPTVVDRTAKVLTVNLDGARTVAESGLQSGASITGASDAGASGGDSGGMILALTTGGSSEEGDYRANTLDAVGDYQVGAFAGAAELGYPFPVPPPAAGAAPEVRLSHSGGSVDGFGGNKSGQPGWMGLGWNLSMGSVTRITRQCYITDTVTNPNRCIVSDKFTLTLNGHSSELVRDTAGGTGRFRLQDDPTWRVELKTDGAAGHPDQQAEYFLVTTPDGTQYRFGGEIEPETGADLDSAFWVPMYDTTLCSSAASKLCNKAWQWNLDRVRDTDGNIVTYFYEHERNSYKAHSPADNSTTTKPYIRAGNVARIEYTKREGSAVQAHARVLFGTELRCANPTQASECDWPTKFIDTPSDLACAETDTCTRTYPTYWTQRRLNHIRTQIWDPATSRWSTVGYNEFGFDLSAPMVITGTITKTLLTSITQRPGGAYERSAFSQIEAEEYYSQAGTQLEASDDVGSGTQVAYIDAGDYLIFKNVDFGGSVAGLLVRASNAYTNVNGTLEFRADSQSGTLLAGITVTPTGGWQRFAYFATQVGGISGVHDLYVRFTGGHLNLNWFRFTPPGGLPGLPATTFDYAWLANRKDTGGGVVSPQILARVMTVTNGLGGQSVFSYGQSHPCPSPDPSWVRPQYDCFAGFYKSDGGSSGSIIFNKWKVLRFDRRDAFSGNPAEVLTYTYNAPIYTYAYNPDTPDVSYWNDFRGHDVVTVTDASGDKTETRFYRGVNGDRTGSGPANEGPVTWYVTGSDGIQRLDYKWLRGKPYESRRISAAGAALTRAETQFVYSITAGSGLTAAYFVAPILITNTLIGSAQTPTKTTQTGYTYDLFGNVLFDIQYGDTTTTTDDRMSESVFVDGSNAAYSTTTWILDKPLSTKLWQGTVPTSVAGLKALTEFAYDGLAYGATPTKGNMTASRSYATFVSWSDYTRYEATTGYDAYGRPISVTDANTQTTNTSYHLFYGYAQTVTLPAALGGQARMSVTTVIDPGWGNVLKVTDANGQVVNLSYDAYGRRTTVKLPLDTANTQEFYYYNAERPARVLSRQLTSGGAYLESHQLVDGFGRSLQAQVNDATTGYRLVTASALNGLGRARYTSGSYQASGLAGTGYVTPTWASIPIYNAASYDALGRQTVAEARSFTTTLYSSTLSYQGWKTIATDANGKLSAREADAFGQLITVTEYLSNATISMATTYAYDFQGNLVKLVDALGNTTTITYDLLGRKLGMRDPDVGVWGCQYDGNNNLTRQTDARGQQIQFLFDALNRPIETRDPSASWTLEKRYYDEAGYGQSKGRRTRAEAYVANALNNTIATSYDARGRVTLDRRSIGGENYDTDFGYDSANRVTGYRYPSRTPTCSRPTTPWASRIRCARAWPSKVLAREALQMERRPATTATGMCSRPPTTRWASQPRSSWGTG